jgi:hypothetical protein
MEARRLVSKVRHLTGSFYRGQYRPDLPRKTVAEAIRLRRKFTRRRHPSGIDAVRCCFPASSIPTHLAFVSEWPVDRANV